VFSSRNQLFFGKCLKCLVAKGVKEGRFVEMD
jgi:hypothetical protein